MKKIKHTVISSCLVLFSYRSYDMPSILWHVALEFLLQSVCDSVCVFVYVYALFLENKVVFTWTIVIFLYLYEYIDSVDKIIGVLCICLQ